MTKEEALKGLKMMREDFSGYKPNEEMFDMAIKALEQEPCEDAVSRKALINAFPISDTYTLDDIIVTIKFQPSVTPTREKGKWIEGPTEQGALGIRYTEKTCSKCGWSHSLIIPQNYCPKCGTAMEVSND